jgi:hypothetical protein
MYRAVVLATLVLLLLAVAGVSVAQESRIFAGEPESTTPEQTSFETTGAENTMMSPPPDAPSETEDQQDTPEPTVVDEATVGEPEKPTTAPAGEGTPTPGGNDAGKPGNSGRDVGNPRAPVGPHGVGKPAERGNEESGPGAGRQKVVLCHKNKTLAVGAPALPAHLRHGDTRGACQGEASGPEPSGETMGAEAARNGEGGGEGQEKVVLCHKNKTLAVGAPAQAAHLRHGDSLGACR